MDTDAHKYDGPEAGLTFAIIGCAMEGLNEVGAGLHEKPYENSLIVEFNLRGISVEQQRRYPVTYKSIQVGEYIPDLIARSAVVVDAKVIDRITEGSAAGCSITCESPASGWAIINFKRPRLEWERIIL